MSESRRAPNDTGHRHDDRYHTRSEITTLLAAIDVDLGDIEDGIEVKINPTTTALVDGATVTIACDSSKAEQNSSVTLGGNRALAWTNIADGMRGDIAVTQDGTGSRTLTPDDPAGFTVKTRDGELTLSTAAGAVDIISWKVLGTVVYMTVGGFE